MSGLSHDLTDWHATAGAVASATGVITSVLEHLPDGGVFFDIGANTGAVTEAAIQHRNAKVYAWEPVSEYADFLLAKFPEVYVRLVALGERPALETLWCDDVNFGWNTLQDDMRTRGMHPRDVRVQPLDAYFDLPRPDVIKIDVEGWEWAVIRGGHTVLAKWMPVIVVELGWGRDHPRRVDVVSELEWLFAQGYERIDYDSDHTQDFTLVPR